MEDTAALIGAFSGLAVAVGALLVSVGVFILVAKIASTVDAWVKPPDRG